ncbi:MAG: AmmeMemoRadiSam system protein B [Acidobacteria bacterium]|nr:AmmeMemoRadiSam system protein B [Acidobacteriota bacterium]MBI3655787.1 AmmeMemoRadiSam system protein B [Acidobacteriota bacterium]
MSETYTKVRLIDAFPVEVSGERYVYLRDPIALGDKMLAVPLPVFFVITLLDGLHSTGDIQAKFAKQFGDIIFDHEIEGITRQLDENHLLENERFDEFRRQLEIEFRQAGTRTAWHAGKVYPAEPLSLRETLSQYFIHKDGPGPIGPIHPDNEVRGAILPHIDFPRGGWCYAWAYKELAERCAADLFLIFGTAHGPMRSPFALTRKNYETPLGPLETDQPFLEALLQSYRGSLDLFKDEFEHRSEHSIEFQSVFLQFLFGEKRKIRAVPILCGSLHGHVYNGVPPSRDREYCAFRDALKTAINGAARAGQKVFCLASADLAHMGPRFGDPFPADSPVLQEIHKEDHELLQTIERVDAAGFHQHIEKDKDRRRICGYPPIYAMLSVLEAERGRVLKYGQRCDDGSVVTFASMVF